MGARNSRSTRKLTTWAACGAGAVVLVLTGYAYFTGDDDEAPAKGKGGSSASADPSPTKPAPTYSRPDDWTEPQRWASLPRGEKTDAEDNPVAFPHSREGAVAMLAASSTTDINASRSAVQEQLGLYRSYMSQEDRSATNEQRVKAQAKRSDATVHSSLGVAAGSKLPAGAYVRTHVVGFKVIKASGNEVSAYLLARANTKAGETKPERGSYSRTLVAAVWENGDWKLSSAATTRASQDSSGQPVPEMVAPGDGAFNAAGWTAIREAS